MRNIGEELKVKMSKKNPQALQTIIEACQHQFWKIDSNNKHLIEPLLHPIKLELEAYPQDDLESMFPNFKRYYISRETQPLTLDDILIACQILCKHPPLQTQAMECINYLNAQSQFFPWMDEYSIEGGNIIVKPKHNKELLEGVAKLQNNELDDIVRMFYKHGATVTDKEAASASLCKLLEVGDTRKLLMVDLTEKQVGLFFDFANNQYIRHGKLEQRKATEHELQIFFDFGLAIVRFADQINKNKNLLDK